MTAALAQAPLAFDNTDLPALVLLGRDDTNKAHAAWFDHTEVDAAAGAATLMGMMTLPITTDEHRALAGRLPHGRIFGSGKAFVPFVKGVLYDDLIAHVPVAQQVRPLRLVKEGEGAEGATPAQPQSKVPTLTVPTDWSAIMPGSVVLCLEAPREGWFESVVIATNGDDEFVLRWRDFPGLPNFERHRSNIGLMHPSASAQG
jgi:hypothetical protein